MPSAPSTSCAVCGAGPLTSGANLCRGDLAIVARDLADVPDVLDDLETTTVRQHRTTPPRTRRGGERPLAWSEAASSAARHLASVVLSAAEQWGLAVTGPGTASAALRARITELRTWPEVGAFAEALRDAVAAARQAVDIPREAGRFDVSACPESVADPADARRTIACPGRVKAIIGRADAPSELFCPSCRTSWPTSSWLRFGRRVLAAAGA